MQGRSSEHMGKFLSDTLSRIKIAPRLAAAFSLPLIGLVALAGFDLLVHWNTRSEMSRLADVANGVAGISRLVHELQRGRGTSVLFLSSKGRQMREDLGQQPRRTDEQRRMLASIFSPLRASAPDSIVRRAKGAIFIFAQELCEATVERGRHVSLVEPT
jgi:hypothetical protein